MLYPKTVWNGIYDSVISLFTAKYNYTDASGQAAQRERIVREWVTRESCRSGAVLAARLVSVLESVERLAVLAGAGEAPPPAAGTLHHLTKRIRYCMRICSRL